MAEPETLIPYPTIVREALRDVPRRVLAKVAEEGLPGAHHFFIELDTQAEGVSLPAHLKAQYPEKMTIVLQNDFHALEVDAIGFGVNLAFGGVRSDLYVPFAAIRLFVDPSVEFALQFAAPEPVPVEEKPAEPKPTTEQKGNVVEVDFKRKS